MSDIPTLTESGGQEVDRIRDIIFGSQMKAIDGHLAALRTDLEQLRQQQVRLQTQLLELDAEQTRRLQNFRAEASADLDGLRTELRATTQDLDHAKADREVLGRMLVDLGQQLLEGGRPFGERLQALGQAATN